MTGFSLQTLGFPEIHGDNGPIKLNLRKGLALLIYLAEAQGAVAREVIATLLWPESPGETSRARLRRMLHRIELTLGQHIFETDRTSVRWSPAVELKVDSHLFESACDRGALEEACLHYRGDFLAGFSLADCPEFDDWAFFRREALRGRLMHGLERLVQDKNARRTFCRGSSRRPPCRARSAERGVLSAFDPQPPACRRSKFGRTAPRGTDTAAA